LIICIPNRTRTDVESAAGSRARARHDLLVPADGLAQANAKRRRGVKSEFLCRPVHIQLAARLAIRFGSVPDDSSLEAGQLDDEVDEVLDRDLLRAADVDRVWLVVPLSGEHYGAGGVVDIEELARRRAGAPHLDRGGLGLSRLQSFADQRGDDMRVV
jgi:hypothetical protein